MPTNASVTQHTPGPWKAEKGADDDPTRCFVTQDIAGQPEYLIAEIQNGAPGDCLETEEANARLIAAAPDLLAVSQLLIRYCSSRDGRLNSYEDWIQCFVEDGSTITEVVEKAAAAIAKAEGTR